ncbi:GNAT family N-acetyltransferase [Tropicimonas sp. S265A]|uniref:GNAT family N-acetyltransferase n=1 Tax=Tropicimonas sp. S265A TaxID=3415134 RepID=UPI003C7B2F16
MILVRPIAQAAEAAPLLRILRDKLDTPTFEARLTAAVAQGYKVVAAFDGHQMIGALGYRITSDLCWGRTLYIDDLVVDPGARGKGTGRRLLEEAHSLAKGCDTMRLCSGLSRHDAHRFYEANGFDRFSLQFVARMEG